VAMINLLWQEIDGEVRRGRRDETVSVCCGSFFVACFLTYIYARRGGSAYPLRWSNSNVSGLPSCRISLSWAICAVAPSQPLPLGVAKLIAVAINRSILVMDRIFA
jgi:hypothetical protein